MGVPSRPLIGIVPNFSEGRRADVIEAIVDALQVPGVALLSRQADPDHNRLDCTLVGPPDAVRASALAGARVAVALIDMTEHRGSHPRMGAFDVLPFMPVRGVSMDACVELARDVGRELAETLGLPVYLYDRAALLEERRSLAEVRRGEYEGLREAVARGERLPDLGRHELGPAGAVAVGARKPLVAFNVYLDGTEEAAKEIARAVRESSGGLPNVRAIGFAVPERGGVTVSMNLVDHEATPVHVAFEAVRREAEGRGMEVVSSEIVGLIPEAALDAAAIDALRLEGFDPGEQVLERLLETAERGADVIRPGPAGTGRATADRSVADWLGALASAQPTPGGGSASAMAGAMAASLLAMVGRLTVDKPEFEAFDARMRALTDEADDARGALLSLADRDAEAFDAVMVALRMPKTSEDEKVARSEALQGAFVGAAEVPLEVVRRAARLLALAVEAARDGNPNAVSDAAVAGQLARAAVEGAAANVEINLASVRDGDVVDRMRTELTGLRTTAADALATVVASAAERLGAA